MTLTSTEWLREAEEGMESLRELMLQSHVTGEPSSDEVLAASNYALACIELSREKR